MIVGRGNGPTELTGDDGHHYIVDDVKYLGRGLDTLRQNAPIITSDILAKSMLEAKGVDHEWITEDLTRRQIKNAVVEATDYAEAYVDAIDVANGDLFADLLGQSGVKFFRSSMKYTFVRFAIGTTLFARGIEAFIARRQVRALTYVHDGGNGMIWPSMTGNVFFFPDDIVWRILGHCPVREMVELNRVVVRPAKVWSPTRQIRRGLRSVRDVWRKRFSRPQVLSEAKETIVLLTPLYDLSPALDSTRLAGRFNLVRWQIDRDPLPEVNLGGGGSLPKLNVIRDSEALDFVEEMVLDVRVPGGTLGFEFEALVAPLVREFVRRKWTQIALYWKGMRLLNDAVSVKALLWGNSPHRYPGGVAVEFCRLAGIPTVGMAHGAYCGSNDTGRSLPMTDYEQCDYFFTYGFNGDDGFVHDQTQSPEYVPIGSTVSPAAVSPRKRRKKERVAVLYPPAVIADHFFTKSELSLPLLGLLRFQKRILECLGQYDDRVVIKFLPHTYARHPLRPYLEEHRPHNITVVDDISFTESLARYDVRVILVDEQSTPLNEALVNSDAHIIVYNDPFFLPLLPQARELLVRRAVVCDTQEDFLQAVEDVREGRVAAQKDRDDGFAREYCSYLGDPVARLEEEIERVVEMGVPKGAQRRER